MQLRCLAGAYAGQVREYAFAAGRAALETGMAERIETSTDAKDHAPRAVIAPKRKPQVAASPRAR